MLTPSELNINYIINCTQIIACTIQKLYKKGHLINTGTISCIEKFRY